jgi:Fe-Mn family superoxide dismutase
MTKHRFEHQITRRLFVRSALAGSAVAAVGCDRQRGRADVAPPTSEASTPGPLALPPLPWAEDALEPHISARTIGFHHGKHHRGYVTKVNDAIASTDLASASLEEIIQATAGDPESAALFNAAAQAWNHEFYWNSMKPGGGGSPSGRLLRLIESSFGGMDGFRTEFVDAATGQFGSGWAWVVLDGDRLVVENTANADTPLARGRRPLLTIDVWEHAYYLDYQNRRKDYVNDFLDRLVSWDFAERNLA